MKIGIDNYDESISKWRPMDDAAKDGSRYLVGWFELRGQRSMEVAFWNQSLKCWVSSVRHTTDKNWQPTHYMILPSPIIDQEL
jgi:hypothetical protein